MKKIKLNKILAILSIILITFSTIYILYAVYLLNGIENIMRLVLGLTLLLILVCSVLSLFKTIKKQKSKIKIAFIIVLIYSVLLSGIAFYIMKTYSTLQSMTTDSTTYSTSLVTLKSNKIEKIDKIDDGKIGILADSTSIVGNTLPLEILKSKKIDNEVLEYDSFIELIQALLDEKVSFAFLPTNYVIMFSEVDGADFENIGSDTKIIYTETKKIENKNKNKNTKLDKPFTVLLMGVDSELEDIANASFNGDSLMLITFNPTTLSSTILSIPRDTYVPIACFTNQRKNKITHAAWYGEECMIETIQNYTGVNIDYYVKINFKGVVKLVDTLGGVDVDVPYAFCEQNSNREWGNSTIYVEEGMQTLNGEQALAFARNRHSWPNYCPRKYSNYISNDFIRGQHQQTVVKSLLNKLKSVKSLNTVSEILNTISNSMETNMTTSEILSLYNIGKDILVKSNSGDVADLLSMKRLYLNGTDAYIYDQSMGLNLYNYVVYENSLNAVVEAMKINLGLVEPKIEKSFSFSIDKEYEEEVIGKDITGVSSVTKLPNFSGDSKAQAQSTCNKLGITCNFKTVSTGSGTNNTVIAQSYTAGYDVSYVKSLTLTILVKEEVEVPKEEVKTVPDFIGDSQTEATAKCNKLGITCKFPIVYEGEGTLNTVIKQDEKVGTDLSKVAYLNLTILKKPVSTSNPTTTTTSSTESSEDTSSAVTSESISTSPLLD